MRDRGDQNRVSCGRGTVSFVRTLMVQGPWGVLAGREPHRKLQKLEAPS